MNKRPFIVAAARTQIAPRFSLHRSTRLEDLAKPVLEFLDKKIKQVSRKEALTSEVILGNALGGGGNPARLCSLAVFGEPTSAMTIDTQCCSGMDAIHLAASRISSSESEVVIAGGIESASRAPQRFRPTENGYEAYSQAQFAPWPDRDPPVLQAAQQFAEDEEISREEQEAWARISHLSTLKRPPRLGGRDPFARTLTEALCRRAPPLIRDNRYSITAVTVAPEADAAAALLIVSGRLASRFPWAIEIIGGLQLGGPPERPAVGGLIAAQNLLSAYSNSFRSKIVAVEIMESFAAQAIHNSRNLGFPPSMVNAWGGLLAAGHAIGASGAVLAGNLALRLALAHHGGLGLTLVPAAGGLGSALLLKKA